MKTIPTLFCMLLALAASVFTTAKAQVNVKDSLALVDLYSSTNGPNWINHSNWLTPNPVNTWYGITVTGTRVTNLALPDNNLSGSIPASIGNLDSLKELHLDRNQLSGAIPASIGNLVKLTAIYLLYNQLSGSIPPEIGKLVNLTFVDLFRNQLSGAIPDETGNLVQLQYLWLADNQLSGPIPAELSKLVKLEQLSLGNNQLSGTIPVGLSNLDNLQFLDLGRNQLSGTIPPDISKLDNLTYLDLSYNQLSGAIPNALGYLRYIGNLFLNNNQLSGTIPASFRKLEHLFRLDLSFNQLHQDENIYFPNKSGLKEGWVNNNLFTFNGLESIAKNYLVINYAPQANITIHQHGNTLSVYAGGTLSNNTYNWQQVGAEGSTVIKADSTFTPSHNGRYYVKVTNKVARQLILHSDTIDFSLSPLKQNTSITKSIQPATVIQHMQVYPNPARTVIHIQVAGTTFITVSNSDGKVLFTKSINNSAEINVSTIAPGIYYLQNKASREVQKVVVVH